MPTLFGSDATELSPAQGAGARPIEGVTVRETPIDYSGFVKAADVVGEAFKQKNKADTEVRKQQTLGITSQYVQGVNKAVETGQMSSSQADVLIRSHFSQSIGANPALSDEYKKLYSAFKETSTTGSIVDEVQLQRDQRKTLMTDAVKDGYPLFNGMSPQGEKSLLDAYSQSLRIRQQLKDIREANAESRTQTAFEQNQSDRRSKEQSTVLLGQLAGTHMDAFNQLGQELASFVQKGGDPVEAKGKFLAYYNKIIGPIQTVSGTHPELAGAYKSLFDETLKTYTEFMKPGADMDGLKKLKETILLKAELTALAEPGMKEVVAASRLLGNNASTAIAATKPVQNYFAKLTQQTLTGIPSGDSIINNPAIEKDFYKSFDDILKNYNSKKYEPSDKDQLNNEIKGSLSIHLNKWVAANNAGDTTPDSRAQLYNMIASGNFGQYVKDNKLDINTLRGLNQVFKTSYVDAFEKGLSAKLDEMRPKTLSEKVLGFTANAIDPTLLTQQRQAAADAKEPKIKDLVDISFEGASLSIRPKAALKGDNVDKAAYTVQQLDSITKAANRVIHIGAHLEGTTDYKKFWEDNKAYLLPSMGYPVPKKDIPVQNALPGNMTEENMKAAAQLTPAEQARSQVFEASQGNINELKTELKRTDLSPLNRSILEAELARLQGK